MEKTTKQTILVEVKMTRGDSGLSDSQFMEVQRTLQWKHEKYVEQKETQEQLDELKKRFKAGAKPPVKKKGLWDIIKGLFK